ncbi:hypothetical protein VNI00_017194 [Paramarasmius palmivorus]|uniref:Uncharacterized protein n=1 Tax=Paramarasmius palmivorus TaxID=297713 RepID=A0AAW0BAJ7_9AGAR
MAGVFIHGVAPIVYARGPGKLHLLSYASNASLPNHVGTISTPADTSDSAVTKFVISHSYTFTRFAFFFEGNGQVVYRIGSDLIRQPVGKSWAQASAVGYGGAAVTSANVEAEAAKAVLRNDEVTAFIVPRDCE